MYLDNVVLMKIFAPKVFEIIFFSELIKGLRANIASLTTDNVLKLVKRRPHKVYKLTSFKISLIKLSSLELAKYNNENENTRPS